VSGLATLRCGRIPARPPLPPEERIRVLQLVASGTNGGAQEHVYSLLAQVDRARYDVTVLTLTDGSAVRRWRSLGFAVEVIEEPDDGIAAQLVAERVVALRSEVIHGHMYRAEVVGTLAADLVQERGLARPWTVNTVHSSRVRSREDRALIAGMTARIDRLIAVSRSIEEKIRDEQRTGSTVVLIYNGVDLTRYDHQEACCTLPEEYGFPAGSPMVGVVGRLETEKGHPTLLEAWPAVLRAVPDARLLIVGEGSRRAALEEQAAALGLLGEGGGSGSASQNVARPGASVVFTGRREDVPAVTAALDVAVLPSYREAQGLAVLEAMALARPVVASQVGGIPEMIDDGVTGLLVPPGEAEPLAAAIVRLLTDHPLADTLARAARDVAHDRFCVQKMAAEIMDLYEEGAREAALRAGLPARPVQPRTTLQ